MIMSRLGDDIVPHPARIPEKRLLYLTLGQLHLLSILRRSKTPISVPDLTANMEGRVRLRNRHNIYQIQSEPFIKLGMIEVTSCQMTVPRGKRSIHFRTITVKHYALTKLGQIIFDRIMALLTDQTDSERPWLEKNDRQVRAAKAFEVIEIAEELEEGDSLLQDEEEG